MIESPAISIAITRLDRDAWARAWSSLPEQRRSTYYHRDYVAAAARWEGGEPDCLHVDGGGGSGLLYPYVRHSVPGDAGAFDVQTAYGYGGPLFIGEWDHAARVEALREVGQYLAARGAVAEFVRCHERWTDLDALRDAGYAAPIVRTNVSCDLLANDVSSTWAPNVRRNLKRAAAAGLRWRVGATAADLGAFTALYAMTADRLRMAASYRFDNAYFRSLFEMAAPLARLVLVETSHGNPVAGAIVLCGGEIAHYHLGGSDFAHQNDRPNDLLYLAMAETARAAGCSSIAWGGGLSTDPADSLFRFKCGFGTHHVSAHIGCRVLNESAYRALLRDWERRNPDRAANCELFLRYRV
jgi:hypothetical protein